MKDMEDEILIIKGWINIRDYSEGGDVSVGGDLIASALDYLTGEQVSVRYYISDKELTENELLQASIETLAGSLSAECEARYSDYTGYLWTDESLEIGGHDLLSEISENNGKYLWLEITIHNQPTL